MNKRNRFSALKDLTVHSVMSATKGEHKHPRTVGM